MRRDWAREKANSVASDGWSGDAYVVSISECAKLLRQRDAQWRRAIKRLRKAITDAYPHGDEMVIGGLKALDDLRTAMEGRNGQYPNRAQKA